jgi:hypothetical protein
MSDQTADFPDEPLLREFSISEIGQVAGPETGRALAETDSNAAGLGLGKFAGATGQKLRLSPMNALFAGHDSQREVPTASRSTSPL